MMPITQIVEVDGFYFIVDQSQSGYRYWEIDKHPFSSPTAAKAYLKLRSEIHDNPDMELSGNVVYREYLNGETWTDDEN